MLFGSVFLKWIIPPVRSFAAAEYCQLARVKLALARALGQELEHKREPVQGRV